MKGANRTDIQIGLKVWIVVKKDQETGALTKGIVKDILTKSRKHPHGIKVRLVNGAVGRVREILDSSVSDR
ncbi:MAG: YwbE family protein [bacterium]|nr:YwbE family protein [bacterium]